AKSIFGSGALDAQGGAGGDGGTGGDGEPTASATSVQGDGGATAGDGGTGGLIKITAPNANTLPANLLFFNTGSSFAGGNAGGAGQPGGGSVAGSTGQAGQPGTAGPEPILNTELPDDDTFDKKQDKVRLCLNRSNTLMPVSLSISAAEGAPGTGGDAAEVIIDADEDQ
ncbi:MAG TPA: hypothetical protein V6D22_01115, partial [Candidatus Obscuribacterales bacterium]